MTLSARNAELVRRYFDDCVGRLGGPGREAALSVLDELLTSDFVMSYNNDPDETARSGREQHKAFLIAHAANYPEDRWTIEELVADDSVVACLWRLQSRHAKTGNDIDVRAADYFKIRDGRLHRLRRFLDFKGLDQQTQPASGSSEEGRE